MSENGRFTPNGAENWTPQPQVAEQRFDLSDPQVNVGEVVQQHHGLGLVMHPGEWHPIDALRAQVDARKALRMLKRK